MVSEIPHQRIVELARPRTGAALDALPPADRERLDELLPLLSQVAAELELVEETA